MRHAPISVVSLAIVTLGTSALIACNSPRGAEPVPSEDVVFQVGSSVTRLSELQRRIDRLPAAVRDRYATADDRRAYVERAFTDEVLAEEARRLGYDKDPDVELATKRAMVLKLLRDRLGDRPADGEITSAAVEAYYREHRDRFVHPEETRVTDIVVSSKAQASALRTAALAAPAERAAEAFRALATEHSTAPDVKITGGDRTFVAGQIDAPAALVDAARGLHEVGEISRVIAAADGYHVLRLRQRTPGVSRSLDEVRDRIVTALTEASRDAKVRALTESVAKRLSVRRFDDRAARLEFAKASAPAAASAPPPS